MSSQHTSDGLGKLPPAALRIPLKMIHRLHQAGIRQIATLSQLPRTSLLDRLGETLLRRLDQAFGKREEFIDVYHAPADFVVKQWLEHPTDNQQTIQWIMLNLLETLIQSLTHHGQGVLQLECHLQCVNKKHLQTTIRLFQATTEPQHLSDLWKMQWNHKSLHSPIQEIKLVATRTAPWESYQRSLFNPLKTDHSLAPAGLPAPLQHSNLRRLAHLIDRLSRRLGAYRVVQPHLQADSQPEHAYQNVSWIIQRPQKQHQQSQHRSNSTTPPRDASATRPLQLLSPAPRLAVTAVALDGPPIRFTYRQHTYHIEHAWGPERIETGWWRGPVIRRDYYRVQTTTGHRFWLFRELHHNHWHLHGQFS
ncbi:MAG TPA: hypothetical protein EYN70_05605 [Planctomycetaceae bacterium]|nr:hypothetical protein [Planctomycetaceae bacterium]